MPLMMMTKGKKNHSLKSQETSSKASRKDTWVFCVKQMLSKQIDIIVIAFYTFISPSESKRMIYFLKSTQYCSTTNTKRHCYCCKSRRGTVAV